MSAADFEKLFNYIKLGAVAAPFFGTWYLILFFITEKIPIPVDTQSLVFLLPVIAVIGMMAALYLFLIILLPALMISVFKWDLRPLFYDRGRTLTLRVSLLNYVLYHGGTLAFLLAWGVALHFLPEVYLRLGLLVLFLYAVTIAIKLSVDTHYIFRDFITRLSLVLGSNLILPVWLVANYFLVSQFLIDASHTSLPTFTGIFVMLVGLHCLQTVPFAPKLDPEKRRGILFVAFVVMLLGSLVPPLPAFLGKASLYALGLGGGKPVHVKLADNILSTLPPEVATKVWNGDTLFLMFASPSRIFLRVDKNTKTSSDIALKLVERIDYVSKGNKIDHVSYSPRFAAQKKAPRSASSTAKSVVTADKKLTKSPCEELPRIATAKAP